MEEAPSGHNSSSSNSQPTPRRDGGFATWTHGAAAALHVDGLRAGQGRAADGGAERLALQAVAVRAAVDVPALLVGVGLPAEAAHHLLRDAVF